MSPAIIKFLAVSMTKWKTNMYLFHANGEIMIEAVLIKRGIFQGDSLSPLLFILAINPISLLLNRRTRGYTLDGMHITHVLYMDDLKTFSSSFESLKKMVLLVEKFTADIGMELGLKKCKIVNLQRGKYVKLGDIELESGGVIQELGQDEVYKYLGVEELDGLKHEDMKLKVWKDAKAKLRKLLESELNSRNLIVAINECILPIISYSFGVLNWLESELKNLDIGVRKMMHMYKAFQIKSDVDRLYASRACGGRGLTSVWDSFKSSMCRISHVMANSSNTMLSHCCRIDRRGLFSVLKRAEKFESEVEMVVPEEFEKKDALHQARIKADLCRKALQDRRLSAWREKSQHGAFLRLLMESNVDIKRSMGWLSKCHLNPRSEAYICAAQEMALFTKFHEKHILHTHEDDKCRVCKVEPETIFHILAGCGILAKIDYLSRHNAVCKYIHFEILEAYSIPRGNNWYVHEPKEVVMGKSVEVIYDQVLSTDRPVGANRPDIVIRDMSKKRVWIIDVSCPCDTNVEKKEGEKVGKYAGLMGELQRMWGAECVVVPVVIGGLGTVTRRCADFLASIPGEPDVSMCQKITLMGSERILRGVLARGR